MHPYVVVIGYRQQLAAALHARGIAFSVWGEKPLKTAPKGVDKVICSPFTSDPAAIAELFSPQKFRHPPSHVIAGSEAAVFPAAALRRYFGIIHHPDTLLARCTDKIKMKEFLRTHAIPMTKFIRHTSDLRAEVLCQELGLPVVIKNRRGSGGRDMIFATSLAEVAAAMGEGMLYETFVDAPEGSIESFVEDGEVMFSNTTEYVLKKIANLLPARYSRSELQEISALNQRVIKAMDISWGLVHLEYYRSSRGILFGEIALRPPGGYIMELLRRAYEFDPWDLFIDVELGIKGRPPKLRAERYAACVVLHPGPGRVRAIKRPSRVQYPSVEKTLLKVKVGDEIGVRHGVSEDVGYCILCDADYQVLVNECRKLDNEVLIEVDS